MLVVGFSWLDLDDSCMLSLVNFMSQVWWSYVLPDQVVDCFKVRDAGCWLYFFSDIDFRLSVTWS